MDRMERKRMADIREEMNREFLERTPEAVDALMDIIKDPDEIERFMSRQD